MNNFSFGFCLMKLQKENKKYLRSPIYSFNFLHVSRFLFGTHNLSLIRLLCFLNNFLYNLLTHCGNPPQSRRMEQGGGATLTLCEGVGGGPRVERRGRRGVARGKTAAFRFSQQSRQPLILPQLHCCSVLAGSRQLAVAGTRLPGQLCVLIWCSLPSTDRLTDRRPSLARPSLHSLHQVYQADTVGIGQVGLVSMHHETFVPGCPVQGNYQRTVLLLCTKQYSIILQTYQATR